MNEGSNRSYSNPPVREVINYPETLRHQHHINQQEYDQFHRERAIQFKEIENSQNEKLRESEGDRTALIKRINTLLVEVDRLSQEKNELATALHEERMISGEMQRKVKNTGKAKNAVDRNLQSDLKFEKEENSRLRHLLHQIEIERAELRSKLKDYDLTASSFSYEKKELTIKIQQKADQVMILETENRSLNEKILFFQSRLIEVEGENSNILQDRSRLYESASRLEIERTELITKLHEEITHSDNFKISKNSEIENMKWIQKRHCRLLASKSLGLELQRLTSKIYTRTLHRIRDALSFSSAKYRGTQKIIANALKYYDRRQKSLFDRWRSQLNWRNTQESRLNLVDLYSDRNTKARLFSGWRNAFLDKLKEKRQQSLSIALIYKLFKGYLENTKRNRFVQFRAYCELDRVKDTKGSSLTIRAFMGKIRSALQKWSRFNERMREVQAREDLATDFAAAFIKAKFFLAIKEYTRLRRKEKELAHYKEDQADKLYQLSVITELKRYTQKKRERDSVVKKMVRRWVKKDLFRGVSTWKKEVKTQRSLEKIELYLRGIDISKSKIVKEKLFYAWKNFLITNKLKKVSEELAIEKPLRQQHESSLHISIADKRSLHQIKAGRIFAKCFRGELYSYFTHWSDHTKYFNESKPRIKRMILKQYIFKIASFFNRWKTATSDLTIRDLHRKNTLYAESNSALLDHVGVLEEALSVSIQKNQEMTKTTMKRVILRIQNFKLATYLRTWAQNAFTSSNMYSAAMMIEKNLRHFVYRKSMAAILARSVQMKKREVKRRKFTNFVMIQMRANVNTFFDAWKRYFFIVKKAKAIMVKATRRNHLIKKQEFLNKWKARIWHHRERELTHHSTRLAEEKSILQKHLEKLSEEHAKVNAKADKFLKNLKKRSRLRIVNSLVRCSQGSRRVFWGRWLAAIALQDRKLTKMSKLRRLWDKNCERKAWKTWNIYIRRKFEAWSSTEISKHIKNTKLAQREAKGTQESLQKQVADREIIINQCENKIEYEAKVKEFLLMRGIRYFDTEYSENRAAFAFKAMKERYARIKRTVLGLADLIQFLKKKSALIAIKTEARQTHEYNSIKSMLTEAFRRYSSRYLRHKFDTWHRNACSVFQNKLREKIRQDTARINEMNQLHRAIKKNNMAKMFAVLMNKTQTGVFSAWAKAARKQKAIRLAQGKFFTLSKTIRFNFAVNKWWSFLDTSRKERQKVRLAASTYMKNLVTRVFSLWKTVHDTGRYVKVVFGGLNKRFYRDSLFTGISAIKSFACRASSNSKWLEKSQGTAITRAMYTKSKKILLRNFRKWVDFKGHKESALSKVRRAILRSLHRKFRTGFDLWQECFLVQKTVEDVNKGGVVAIENSLLKERNHILLKLIEDEGLDQRYVERYINEREDLKAALKRKGIGRLRYKAGLTNPNDTSLVPRLFLTWKLWVIKRQRIVRYAHRMMAYRKKPDLMKAFLTWKRGFPLVVNTINKLPRRELYGLVAKMDRDIKTLEGRLENSNSEMVYMQAYSEVLQTHTRRGQNLALVLAKNNTQKSFYRVFLRWSMHTNLCKVHDLLANLTSVEENYYVSKTTVMALEEDNQIMLEENMELRQASLDGIAIAEAFETLSKERERLSVDLAERTATIKRLLEHNNELAFKLKQFSIDEKFATPDREMYRTRKN